MTQKTAQHGAVSRRFVVVGRVQGVGFRYATKSMADGLALTGWVKNRPDGGVEVAARGDLHKLAELEAWLWAGPAHARVDEVGVLPADSAASSETDDGFRIRV